MTNVSKNKRIVLDDYISRLDNLYINGRGTHVQFDVRKHVKKYSEILYSELKIFGVFKFIFKFMLL